MLADLWNYLKSFVATKQDDGLEGVESKLQHYASCLGLQQYCQKKLSKKDITTIGRDELDSDIEDNREVWRFLKKLLLVNSSCKKEINARSPPKRLGSELGNYTDTIITLFFCADDFLRRFLVEKLQLCQLAIPFILPITNEVMIWPTRIVRTWKDAKSRSHEESLASYPMPFVLVVQMSASETLKLNSSELLNAVLSSEGATYRGFSDLKGKYLHQTYTELGWYLPGTTAKHFPDAIGFFNFWGNKETSLDMLECLAKVSSMVVIVTDDPGKDLSVVSRFCLNKMVIVALQEERSLNKSSCHYELISGRDTEEAAEILRTAIQEKFSSMPKMSLESVSDVFVNSGFRVDEQEEICRSAKEKMQTLMCEIQGEELAEFKKSTLFLQMNWGKWSDLEKEQSRLRHHKPSQVSVENYVANLEVEKANVAKQMKEKGFSSGFKRFLFHLKQLSGRGRIYFLEWMKYELDALSRKEMRHLHRAYEESLYNETDDTDKIEVKISKSSLGLEHYFREMGVSVELKLLDDTDSDALANIAAELLLEGYPLEIIDGDALCIPVRWIKKVLEHVNQQENKDCNLFSLSIVGVQSSGKSTFVNTAFGISFAVSSGRCTRGAYMQLLKVKGHLKEQTNADFVAVIDTEGLKSSETASISTERDNELGTIAVGAADMSLINIAMEDIEGIKDVLQIVVYSFLRMSRVKEKPVCTFIHQNINDMKAEKTTLRERKKFMKGMDEMTKLAAKMEKMEASYKQLSDVMEFDDDKLSVYIPSLWKDTPPMSAVSIAYSDAAKKVRVSVMEKMGDKKSQSLLVFAENLNSLWTAVKKESFIFSFENVALVNAYEALSSFYVQQKWKAKTCVISWAKQKAPLVSSSEEAQLLSCERNITEELNDKLKSVHKDLKEKLTKYFTENAQHSQVFEKFRGNYECDVEASMELLRISARREIGTLFAQRRAAFKLKDVERKGEAMVRKRIKELQDKYSTCSTELSTDQTKAIEAEFNNMWTNVIHGIQCEELDYSVDVEGSMLSCFKEYMTTKEVFVDVSEGFKRTRSKGGKYHVSEDDLNQSAKDDWIKVKDAAQLISQKLFDEVEDEIHKSTSKCRLFTEQDCFHIIERSEIKLKAFKSTMFQFTSHFHANFIKEVCSAAVPKLQAMHDMYIKQENPVMKLGSLKKTYLGILVSAVFKRNCTKVFINDLKNAIVSPREFLFEKVSTILEQEKPQLCSRKYIQLEVLLDLKKTDKFAKYLRYIENFKPACLSWMQESIIEFLKEEEGGEVRLIHLGLELAEELLAKLEGSIRRAAAQSSNYIKFLDGLHIELLQHGVVRSSGYLDRLKMLQVEDLPPFLAELKGEVPVKVQHFLRENVKMWDVAHEVCQIRPSLEEQLFEVVMCKEGAQCPFCGVPCDKSGPHSQHESGLHQPCGLNRYRWVDSQALCTDICTTLVSSNCCFRNSDTGNWFIDYRNYARIYPRWMIKPSSSPHSGFYWKWVFANYQEEFAKKYQAFVARDMPAAWAELEWPEVKKDLEGIYGTKVVDKYERSVPKPE